MRVAWHDLFCLFCNHPKTMKYTKGKWQVETAATGKDGKTVITEYFVRRDGDSMAIANDITDPETEQPSEANARLIAAAPDLLAACREGLKRVAMLTPFTVDGCDPVMEKAIEAAASQADQTREILRAALEKALGPDWQNAQGQTTPTAPKP